MTAAIIIAETEVKAKPHVAAWINLDINEVGGWIDKASEAIGHEEWFPFDNKFTTPLNYYLSISEINSKLLVNYIANKMQTYECLWSKRTPVYLYTNNKLTAVHISV